MKLEDKMKKEGGSFWRLLWSIVAWVGVLCGMVYSDGLLLFAGFLMVVTSVIEAFYGEKIKKLLKEIKEKVHNH